MRRGFHRIYHVIRNRLLMRSISIISSPAEGVMLGAVVTVCGAGAGVDAAPEVLLSLLKTPRWHEYLQGR